LNSNTTSWNETVVRTFLPGLAQDMMTNKPNKLSDDQNYHLFPFVVSAIAIDDDEFKKRKKKISHASPFSWL
jgi:hypothetical protein